MLFRKFKVLESIKNFHLICSLFLVVYFAEAQEVKSIDAVVGSIRENDLKRHLEIISHDSLEGRETGQPGLQKAAEYLQNQFKEIGLNPIKEGSENPYYQSFNLVKGKWGEVILSVEGVSYKNMEDFIYVSTSIQSYNKNISLKFAGQGIKEDYDNIDCSNKGVVILLPEVIGNWEEKLSIAKDAGIKEIFFIYGSTDENIEKVISSYRNYLMGAQFKLKSDTPEDKMKVFLITPGMAERMFDTSIKKLKSSVAKAGKGKYKSINKIQEGEVIAEVESTEDIVETENVIGFVEGQQRPDEVLIISAHYDHVGMKNGEIYNGADDNGSGTAAILELAEAFALAREMGIGPKRSVMFILLTGEEKGLLGSSHYVSHPLFPLNKTIANLNIDMIGRIDNTYVDNPGYVYLIGSDKISQELHMISEEANKNHIGLILDYTYNAEDHPEMFYYRSDHYNFAKNGIPVIFYFTGVHDDYHKPTDVIDKILFDRMALVTKLIFYTAWEVSNMERNLK